MSVPYQEIMPIGTPDEAMEKALKLRAGGLENPAAVQAGMREVGLDPDNEVETYTKLLFTIGREAKKREQKGRPPKINQTPDDFAATEA